MKRELPKIGSPTACLAAWCRFLRRQGATVAEIARALGLSELEAARLAGGHCPSQPDSATEASEGRSP